ncbi:MAG TPA: hypothetical protein VGA19_08885 [Rhodospirillales bacterium]|jgi:hypothetical protein
MSGRGPIGRARPGVAAPAAVSVLAAALALAACGIKSQPETPPGATYPKEYPAPEKQSKTPAGEKDSQVSPQGFPYEYPNRPPSR